MGAVSPQIIDRKTNVQPVGNQNGVNLTYQAPERFDPSSLEVFLSGLFLEEGLDYVVSPDNTTFNIIVNPGDPVRLNCPPQQFEPFRINYVTC